MFERKRSVLVLLPILAGIIFIYTGCNRMPEGNPADGARWFKLYRCEGCHGENGSGGKGPVIAGTSLSFNRFLHKLRKPNSAIMPVFDQQRVPDQDAGEIYLWLQQQKK